MYVAQLTLKQQAPSDRDAASDAINTLLGSLRMNGQIYGREFPITVIPEGYRITLMLPEATSLNAAHRNRWVRKGFDKLREIGFAESTLQIAEDLDGAEACACQHPSCYLLYTTYVSLESPLRCGDCFSPVPLYGIPPLRSEEYNDILSWQSYYQACDTLQMNCTPIERTAMRQLTRCDSGLSQQGRDICRQIQALTRIPVYYYLYKYNARSRKQEEKRLCPSCQSEWRLPERWHLFDFRCDRCCLVSNIAWNTG